MFRHALLQAGLGGLASQARHGSGRIFVLAAAESGDQFEHGVKRGLEWLCVSLDLGEQEPTLQGGQQRKAERVGVGLGRELASCVHLSKTALDGGLPPSEGLGNVGSCFGIGLGELASE